MQNVKYAYYMTSLYEGLLMSKWITHKNKSKSSMQAKTGWTLVGTDIVCAWSGVAHFQKQKTLQ